MSTYSTSGPWLPTPAQTFTINFPKKLWEWNEWKGNALTAWQMMGYLIWLMPPANTAKVRAVWKQKLRSICHPFRLMRIALPKKDRESNKLAGPYHTPQCSCDSSWSKISLIFGVQGTLHITHFKYDLGQSFYKVCINCPFLLPCHCHID